MAKKGFQNKVTSKKVPVGVPKVKPVGAPPRKAVTGGRVSALSLTPVAGVASQVAEPAVLPPAPQSKDVRLQVADAVAREVAANSGLKPGVKAKALNQALTEAVTQALARMLASEAQVHLRLGRSVRSELPI